MYLLKTCFPLVSNLFANLFFITISKIKDEKEGDRDRERKEGGREGGKEEGREGGT